MFNVLTTHIPGVVILEPRIFADKRGYFFESFSAREFNELVAVPITGRPITFVQDNQSKSCRGTVRGLHFQRPPYTQSKLVRCAQGAIRDVVVDVRKGSPTYLQHVAVDLTEDNCLTLFVPRGFAHGFSVLSDEAVLQYKCDEYYHPESDDGIQLADPSLGIEWGLDLAEAVVSDKDRARACVADRPSVFDFNASLYAE